MQNLSIFGYESGFFFCFLLTVLWLDINSFINFTLTIINLKVVPWQLLSSADLSRTQVFYDHEALKIIIVYKYKNFMLAAV